jgi:hypothetical protein
VRARKLVYSLIITLLVCVTFLGQETPKSQQNHDPDAVLISTADVDLFFNAYDIWQKQEHGDPAKLAAVLQQEYLDKGSLGVRAFISNRIVSADHLAKVVLSHAREYEASRKYGSQIKDYVPEIHKNLHALKRLYPDAAFPAIYFVIGAMNSGGTSSDHGLILGAEMFGDQPEYPLKVSEIAPLATHELVHFQQKGNDNGLLRAAMREGAADFIAELAAGRHANEGVKAYGDSHEQELWVRFQRDLKSGNKIGGWMYYDPAEGEPRDLGYYMGYKICQSYYQNATDKAAALKKIVEMESPEDILAGSAYDKRFH